MFCKIMVIIVLTTAICFQLFSHYSGLDDWTKKGFSSAVNITDKALVLLVVKHYVPKWENVTSAASENVETDSGVSRVDGREGCRSEDGKSKRGGAVKGDSNTCIKQKACYYEYCIKVQQARGSRFSQKWDDKLKEEALRLMLEQEERSKAQLSVDIVDHDSEVQEETMQVSRNVFVHGIYGDLDISEQEEV
jgi:hypothetical protein